MLKLGEYSENEAKLISSYLRDAGIKVEQKASIDSILMTYDALEGKASDLRGEIEDFEKYERYLGALRAALAKGAKIDDFMEEFFRELDPEWESKRVRIAECFETPEEESDEEDIIEGEQVEAEDSEVEDSGVEEALEAEVMSEIIEDEDVKVGDEKRSLSESLIMWIEAYSFANATLSENRIKAGEEVGDRLDDPVLRIKVDPNDYPEDTQFHKTLVVRLIKQIDLYIDEFTAPLYTQLDDDFQDEYPDEFVKMMTFAMLIADLVEGESTGKIHMEAFRDLCEHESRREGDVIRIDGTNVAEEIARVLEKNGIIKIKGDTVKWRRSA